MALLSRRGGESFLAILAGGAFKGRRGASLGAGAGLALLLSSGGGGGKQRNSDGFLGSDAGRRLPPQKQQKEMEGEGSDKEP